MRTLFLLPTLLVASATACGSDGLSQEERELAAVTEALTVDPRTFPSYAAQALPASYNAAVLAREIRNPLGNTTTDAGATLGRVLFHDRELSRTRTVSCSSCHLQAAGFGDTARFSLGFDGVTRTALHSMRLANARFNESGRYFWDRRAIHLEAQATEPVRDAGEMGFDAANGGITALLQRLAAVPYYPPLFRYAFGDATITEDRVQRALAQYVRSILAVNSRWDQAFAQVTPGPPGAPPPFLTPLPGFTAQEQRGQELYFRAIPDGGGGCQSCHLAPSFSLSAGSQGNGLDAGETRIFRSPSLKNAALSRRFMHDGRFASLEEVVEFYDSGVQPGPVLDARLRTPGGQPLRLNLSTADKAALVAFLRTLTDQSVITDPRFSSPFRQP